MATLTPLLPWFVVGKASPASGSAGASRSSPLSPEGRYSLVLPPPAAEGEFLTSLASDDRRMMEVVLSSFSLRKDPSGRGRTVRKSDHTCVLSLGKP